MTRSRSIITVTGVGAAVCAAVAGTLLTSSSAGATVPTSGTFTVRAHHGTEADIDLGRKGFSAGDEQLSTGALTRGGTHVGTMIGSCTTVRVGRTADQLCEFVLRFGTSQLTASGAVHSTQAGPGTFSLPILGGTGRYRSASGVITIQATNGPTVPITVSLD